MKTVRLITLVVVLSLTLVLPASAQTYDIVNNGTFDSDVSGWTMSGGTLTRTTTVVHSGSGAAEMMVASGGIGEANQCNDISSIIGTWPTSGGKKYLTFSGWIKTNDTPDTVRITVRFYSSTDCSGGQISEALVDHNTGVTDWKQLSSTAEIPASTQSVKIELNSWAFDAHTTYWDDIRAFSSTATVVRLDGFTARSEETLWVFGGAVALLVLAASGLVLRWWVRRSQVVQ